jgi:nucleotide-binding universal stress UspA family protein
VTVSIPVRSNRVADYLVHLSDMAREQEAASLAACQDSLAYFRAQAEAADVLGQALLETADLYRLSERVALRARTRDLSIIPLAGPYDGQVEVVESVIFNSGRPVVVFRAGEASLSPLTPAKVVVAWDGSPCAARAMADALPILKLASHVRLLTILNEKPAAVAGLCADVVRHLAAHGVSAEVDEVDAAGRPIGHVLDIYIAAQQPDLLVMGAYGHSRLREFILGGATEHMLHAPKTPLFLSH